jgi:hypothetical protein
MVKGTQAWGKYFLDYARLGSIVYKCMNALTCMSQDTGILIGCYTPSAFKLKQTLQRLARLNALYGVKSEIKFFVYLHQVR